VSPQVAPGVVHLGQGDDAPEHRARLATLLDQFRETSTGSGSTPLARRSGSNGVDTVTGGIDWHGLRFEPFATRLGITDPSPAQCE
jgi:hypothetical protein